MKSRNFLHSNPTETTGSAPSGFLLARPSNARATENSAVRRFELQHNSSPRFARRRQERRKGQALLLAVLIMLLAALLSAGFLAVVSGNLNQSARIADKTRAIEASRAGVAFANAQLSGSSQGDLWRPIDVNPALAPTDTRYNFYYSQLDKVQGWAAKTPPQPTDQFPNVNYPVGTYAEALQLYRNTTYGKFPAPEQAIGDAPKFLVKAEEIPINPSAPNYDAKHAGEIKITSIGLSEDDPNVFHRSIAYKVGRKKSPWASALRSVSNWNFGTNDKNTGVPFATNPVVTGTEAAPGVTPTLPNVRVQVTVNAADKPLFSNENVPFNVVIVKKDGTPTVRGAVVTQVNATGTQLTLAKLDGPIGTNEVIQKAAAIGTGSTIDLLNTGTPTSVAATFPNYAQPNGIVANGSLWLQNQVQLSNLSKLGTQLLVSGSLAIDNSAASVSKPVSGSDMAPSPGGYPLVPSNVGYPGNNIVLTTTAVSDGVKKTDLVNDGWNKIGAQTLGLDYSNSRDVEPFKPVKIDSAENLARYRALTRNADTDSNGYKLGVYIDNRDDVEKVGNTAMTQQQLVAMLLSPSTTTPTDYQRTGTAAAAGAIGSSLEQKHLRGWVGADEFLARGALVEISPDPDLNGNTPSLRVTLDARGDSTAAAPNNDVGPVATKAWRRADGTTDTGVYTRILPFPANGTLFAEGNLRIRGDVGTRVAPRSLTVVSLGNIYIEGSLSIDNTFSAGTTPDPNRKKLMLLAKKNVIVNPTRAIVARTDVQTVAANNATPVAFAGTTAVSDAKPLQVANAYPFNVGDYITVQGATKVIRGLVTAKTGNTQLTISTPDTDTVSNGATVRSPLEKRDLGTPASVSAQAVFSVVDTESALNRRIVAPITLDFPNNSKLVFDHVGDMPATKVGLNIKAGDATTPQAASRPADFTATLTNKQTLSGTTQDIDPASNGTSSASKLLRTYNNFTPSNLPNPQTFNYTGSKTLRAFADEVSLTTDFRPGNNGQGVGGNRSGYRYVATLTAPPLAVPPNLPLDTLPALSLAGVGLRYDPGAVFVPSTDPATTAANNRRKDFNTTAGYTIPLATSVEYDFNGTAADQLMPTTTSPLIRYLGFSPILLSPDDATTVDESFYQTKANILKSTLDPRILNAPAFPSFPAALATSPDIGQSIVMRRSPAVSDAARSALLPDYRVRSFKLENFNSNLTSLRVKPVATSIKINAFVYAQEGSWLIIPGDYFRSTPQVRGIADSTGRVVGSYIDYGNTNPNVIQPDPGEFILSDPSNVNSTKVADLNRNGVVDNGEKEAALRFVRYNYAPIQFLGAIVENQTAVVADVANPTAGAPPVVKGAVQDWMDKWTTYDDSAVANTEAGKKEQFKLIQYTYDPAIANGNANGLRVPITDDLIYQQ